MNKKIKVFLWGEEIGSLIWKNDNSFFLYNSDYIQKGIEPFPLEATISKWGQKPIKGDDYVKDFQSLPSFIADSLPDSWGNELFKHWQKTNNVSKSDINSLDKLSFIGKRGMGALEFVPETPSSEDSKAIEIQSLLDLANRIYLERDDVKISSKESLSLQSLIYVGTSAGGRKPKLVIAINDKTGEIRSGQVCADKDYSHYILKIGDSLCTSEIEMTYYQMACDAGISMMESKLWNIDNKNHFLTRRFDRKNGDKLHTQTLLAMDPESDSYESLIYVCRSLHLPDSEYTEVFRRMVFNILSNNTDDHNKNFSFLMNRKGEWSLSPAYDLTYIMSSLDGTPDTRHSMYIYGKKQNITKDDVLNFAKHEGIRHPEKIIDEVSSSLLKFREYAKSNNVSDIWINKIESCIRKHLEEWGLMQPLKLTFSFKIKNDIQIENAQIRQIRKDEFKLTASINGNNYGYTLRKKNDDYSTLISKGISNLEETDIRLLVDKYLIKKYEGNNTPAKELLYHYKNGELDDNTLIVISSCFNESELDILSDQLRDMKLIESKTNLTMADEPALKQIIEQGKELSGTIIYKQLLGEPTIGRQFEALVLESLQDDDKRQIIFSALDEYTSEKFIKDNKSIDYEGSIDLIRETVKKLGDDIKIVDYDILPENIRKKRMDMDSQSLTIVNDIVCEYHQIQTLRCEYEKSIKSFESIEIKCQSQAFAKNPVFQQLYEKARADKDNKIADITATLSSMKYFSQEKLDKNISEEQTESQSRGMRR